jgi:hypothetical protein
MQPIILTILFVAGVDTALYRRKPLSAEIPIAWLQGCNRITPVAFITCHAGMFMPQRLVPRRKGQS